MKKIIITSFLIGASFAVNAQTGEKTESQTPQSAQHQSPREASNEKTPTTRTASSNKPVEAPQPKKTQSVPGTGETTTPKPAENNSSRSSGKKSSSATPQ